MALPFWSETPEGLEVRVRVTPKGGRDAIEAPTALADGREVLRVRVRVAPEDGAANLAVARLLAAAAGVPQSAVHLAAGATARVKTFRITGAPAALRARLGA